MGSLLGPLARAIVRGARKEAFRVVPATPLDGVALSLDLVGKRLGFFAEIDVVPPAEVSFNDPPRPVIIGCHSVDLGLRGTTKYELKNKENNAPRNMLDPTYHWAVIVGDYYHELNPKGISRGVKRMHIQNGYQNGKIGDGNVWTHQVQVGFTNFNDVAIVAAGKEALGEMPQAYNVISNNCQTFVTGMIKIISPDANMSDVKTFRTVVSYIKGNSTDSKVDTQKKVNLVTAQNIPAVNAAALMESVTPDRVV